MTENGPLVDDLVREEHSPSGLAEHVRDARLLLDYAVKSGLEIDPDTIKRIVEVSRLTRQAQIIDEPTEVAFMSSLAELSRKCLPVTPFSLKAIVDESVAEQSRLRRWLRLPKMPDKSSLASRMLRFYRRTLFSFILVAIFVQATAIFGNAAVQSHSEFKQVIAEYRQVVELVNNPPRATGSVVFDPKIAEELEPLLDAAEEQSSAYQPFWRVSYLLFYKPLEWLLPRAFVYDRDPTLKQNQTDDPNYWHPDEDRTALAFTSLWISVLSATIVPLVYGFLGANTRVLRRLSLDIGSYSLQRNARVAYGLRLSIGGISGLAIGLFVSPDFESGLVDQLSPAALAFLAGYSSELLFSALDRFVNAFTRPGEVRQGGVK